MLFFLLLKTVEQQKSFSGPAAGELVVFMVVLTCGDVRLCCDVCDNVLLTFVDSGGGEDDGAHARSPRWR